MEEARKGILPALTSCDAGFFSNDSNLESLLLFLCEAAELAVVVLLLEAEEDDGPWATIFHLRPVPFELCFCCCCAIIEICCACLGVIWALGCLGDVMMLFKTKLANVCVAI